MHAAKHVNGKVLWANIHLLFWLSLFPFATGWMGENHFTTLPVALYGIISFCAGTAYYILARKLIESHGENSTLAIALGRDNKGLLSMLIYGLGIAFCFVNAWIGFGLYVVVAAMWFIPDKRIENKISSEHNEN